MYINKIESQKVFELKNEINFESDAVASKTLVQYKNTGITLFSLDKDEW